MAISWISFCYLLYTGIYGSCFVVFPSLEGRVGENSWLVSKAERRVVGRFVLVFVSFFLSMLGFSRVNVGWWLDHPVGVVRWIFLSFWVPRSGAGG